jgi:hypothetical protein
MSISSIGGINGLQGFSNISRSTHKILRDIVAIINSISANERKTMFGSTAKITVKDIIKATKVDPFSKLSSLIEAVTNSSSVKKNSMLWSNNQILAKQLMNALNQSKGVSFNHSGLDHRMKMPPPVNNEKILEAFEIIKLLEQKIKVQEEGAKLELEHADTIKLQIEQEKKEKVKTLNISLEKIITNKEITTKKSTFQAMKTYSQLLKTLELETEKKNRTLIMRNGVEYQFVSKEDKENFEKTRYNRQKGFWGTTFKVMTDYQYKAGEIIKIPNGSESRKFIDKMPGRKGKEIEFRCNVILNNDKLEVRTYATKGEMQKDINKQLKGSYIIKDICNITIIAK